MKRIAAMIGGLTLAGALVTGCGSDDSSSSSDSNGSDSGASGGDYCGEVQGAKDAMQSFGGADATIKDMRSAVGDLEKTAEAAPEDVSSDWNTIASQMDKAVSVLEDLDVPADKPFQQMAQDLDPKQQQEMQQKLSTAMQEAGSKDMQASADKLEKQVKDECDIELSSSGEQQAPESQ